jgi:hypothetical protein
MKVNKPKKDKLKHVEVNKLAPPHKKIKYCSLISQMIKKNNKKFTFPLIYSVMEYLNVNEKLIFRLISKQWNDVVVQQLPFLKDSNFINFIMNKQNENPNSFDSIKNNKSILTSGVKIKKIARKSLSRVEENIQVERRYLQSGEENINFKRVSTQSEDILFENSNKKFSKKKVLVKLINSKNYNTIKSKVTLGQLTRSRNLSN